MRVLSSLLLMVSSLGCQAPAVSGPHCPALDRTVDLTGRALYEVHLDAGARVSREVWFAHEEDFLWGFDEDGVAFVFPVVWRLDVVEAADGCSIAAGEQAPSVLRSHVRVDWGQELSGAAAAELLGGPIEPVTSFYDPEPDPARSPVVERDDDGRLVFRAFSTVVLDSERGDLLFLRHELTPLAR